MFVFQSTLASAALITDYELAFSPVDDVVLGETFDVEMRFDDPSFFDLWTFGVDITSPLTNVSFDGFTLAAQNDVDVNPFSFSQIAGTNVGLLPPVDNLIATLHFSATNVGSQSVNFFSDFDFFSGSGATFFSGPSFDGSIGGAFDVNVVAAQVPEPSAFMILMLGFAGLVMKRKAQKS